MYGSNNEHLDHILLLTGLYHCDFDVFQILFVSILFMKDPEKTVKALRKIGKEYKIDRLSKLITDHWGSDDNPLEDLATEGTEEIQRYYNSVQRLEN